MRYYILLINKGANLMEIVFGLLKIGLKREKLMLKHT
jgi:hypothetical protein